MLQTVARSTKRNQVVELIIATFASVLHMMDLKVYRRSAVLATPTVPFQHLASKPVIFLTTEF
jgi:hypothetical protein